MCFVLAVGLLRRRARLPRLRARQGAPRRDAVPAMTAAAAPLRSPRTRADPGSLRAAWRVFWYGGRMSYGMLFNWARPSIYIPTLIGGPTFQLFFFAALGSYATDRSPAYFAIGNAVQVSALAGVFGMTMAIANERWFGTLPALLASPPTGRRSSPAASCRSSPNGLFVSALRVRDRRHLPGRAARPGDHRRGRPWRCWSPSSPAPPSARCRAPSRCACATGCSARTC